MIPTSLYIHIPWCIRKCPYCDFNSHKSPETLPEERYIQALIRDLDHDIMRFGQRPLHSIFIGGGTPSLLSAEAYSSLFQAIQERLPFAGDIEITLEANPGTVEQQRFLDYRTLGINRLSLGIQSFSTTQLQRLGRIHDAKQAHQAIETARKAGFQNINLDIMHGLPEQTIGEGLIDLETALSFHPEHLSWYQLTIEPNTIFYKTQPQLPHEDDAYQLEESGFAVLLERGYQRYEISAFCQPNRPSQHNLNYWLFGDYFGIGAGAHGKLTTEEGIYRTRKQRQPGDYLNNDKPFLAEIQSINRTEQLFEFMLNTTRLEQAIEKALFVERTGQSLEKLEPLLMKAQQQGLIMNGDSSWQITSLGRRFTNDLQTVFLSDD